MYTFSKYFTFLIAFICMPFFLAGQNTEPTSKKIKTSSQFYIGLTTGIGLNAMTVNKEVNFSNRLGVVLPIQPSLAYRWSDTWALELVGGVYLKEYRLSVDRFFLSDNIIFRPRANLNTAEGNATVGLYLNFRKPLNSRKSVYLGASGGYGLWWQIYQGTGGSGSCRGKNSSALPSITAIPDDCEKSILSNYSFKNGNFGYAFLGLNLDLLTNYSEGFQSPFLRLSVVIEDTLLGVPFEGDMIFYEGMNVVEAVEYFNTGGYMAFEVGYFLPLGKKQ